MTLSPHRGWTPRFAVTGDGASLYMGAAGRIWKMALTSGIREPVAFSATVRHDLKDPVTPQEVAFLAGDSIKPLSILEPRMSPDGSTLVFGAAGHLWRQSLDGGEAQRLFEGSALERVLRRFLPDGRQLTFVRTERGQEEVRILDFDSGVVRTVTSGLELLESGLESRRAAIGLCRERHALATTSWNLTSAPAATKQLVDVRWCVVVAAALLGRRSVHLLFRWTPEELLMRGRQRSIACRSRRKTRSPCQSALSS